MAEAEVEPHVVVTRRAACLRVAVELPEAAGSARVEVAFAGDGGAWFRVERSGRTRVYSRREVAQHPPLASVVRLIGDELALAAAPCPRLLSLLLKSLLVYERRVSVLVPRPRWGRPLRRPAVERALSLLEADVSKYWTVDRLARAVGLSRPVLAREFVRALGLSPMRYLTGRRMQLAAQLLENTDASLSEVAAQVGYASEFAFGRAFKQHHGVAPGRFRREASITAQCGAWAA
jgi:AraC-like DNA-binding protein